MTKQEILQEIYDILEQEFELERENLHPDSDLFEDFELDSLDAVDLILALEKKFEFRADEEQAKKLRKIEDIVVFIDKRHYRKSYKYR